MQNNKSLAILLCLSAAFPLQSMAAEKRGPKLTDYPTALVSFDDFKHLVTEVEPHRKTRLIDFDTFVKMSREKNTVVLDSRSTFRFERKHLKGAKHLSFTDFTQANLQSVLPDKNARILIYCNNNFDGDPVDFATKMVMPMVVPRDFTTDPIHSAPVAAIPSAIPSATPETQILGNRKPLTLALNIPTYINLYGYGYRNVFELNELLNITDPRVQFEGTVVFKAK
ncbi:rhodanese-like domain-containing protein [soil metagenome]